MKRIVLSALWLCACAGGGQGSLSTLSSERVARAEQLDAAHAAPIAYRAFQKARSAAEHTRESSPARGDHESAARLWLETAIEQAESTQLAQQRLASEREGERNDTLLLAQETERRQLELSVERELAAQVARTEAERALTRAAQAPAQRIKLDVAEVQRAASALLTRAELVALSLPSTLPESARQKHTALVAEARKLLAKAPDRALELADRALFEALALLGAARASGAPDDTQKASLREALQLAGGQVTRDERGLTASLAANDARAVTRTLQRLCDVARAYPQGPVQVSLKRGSALSKAAAGKLLSAQACTGERYVVVDAESGAALAFTFLSY